MKTKTLAKTIYPFKVVNIEGDEVSLEAYKGKVVLIVNTASQSGFMPQYRDLETLYKSYRNRGFEILAFPSNDFGRPANQPTDFAHFRTSFPVFEPATVKGKNAIPLFRFLSNKTENGTVNMAPTWNFQKYLINRNGEVVNYYFPFTKPLSDKVKKGIERLL